MSIERTLAYHKQMLPVYEAKVQQLMARSKQQDKKIDTLCSMAKVSTKETNAVLTNSEAASAKAKATLEKLDSVCELARSVREEARSVREEAREVRERAQLIIDYSRSTPQQPPKKQCFISKLWHSFCVWIKSLFKTWWSSN